MCGIWLSGLAFIPSRFLSIHHFVYLYLSCALSLLPTFIWGSFSPFAAVSLCGVAGLAETFPFRTVSGPFLLDAPRRHVPPDRILPSQLWSSSRALPLHLHFYNCSDVLGFVSPFDVAKPLQPSPSHNRRYLFQFRFLQDFLIPPVF